MTIVTVVPNTQPVFDWIAQWPRPTFVRINSTDFTEAQRGYLSQPYQLDRTTSSTPQPLFGGGQGGTGVASDMISYKGQWAWSASTTGVVTTDYFPGCPIMPTTDITNLADGWSNPSWRRVFWVTLSIAIDNGVLDDDDGFLFIPLDRAAPATDTWPTAGANNGGFGIVGDGAGGLSFASYTTGAFPGNRKEIVSLSTISDASDFNLLDFVFISGAPGREAQFALNVNGSQFLTRSWVTGTTLENYSGTQYQFCPAARMGTASGDRRILSEITFRFGRFTPTGVEVLT